MYISIDILYDNIYYKTINFNGTLEKAQEFNNCIDNVNIKEKNGNFIINIFENIYDSFVLKSDDRLFNNHLNSLNYRLVAM